jgi:hypothetical protein
MDATMSKWAQPQAIDDVTVAFPARVVGTLLPRVADIPREFYSRANPWATLASRWFFSGLSGRFAVKPGIDERTALRHLSAVLRSFEPQHEHKEAGVAFLMSQWFDGFCEREDG